MIHLLPGVLLMLTAAPRDLASDTWAAVDGLGRRLPDHAAVGAPRPDKTVGIFYFTWLGEHTQGVYDLSKMLAANPTDPAYGPRHAFHFWGEPRFGYYRSDDPWVQRKHLQLLADAGVDVLFLDATNAFTYDHVVRSLCQQMRALAATGRRVPQFAFLLNSRHQTVAPKLYQEWYQAGLYPECWFRWQGKPLLLSPSEGLSDELRGFFTLRQSWAWTKGAQWFGDGRDKWPWLDHHPQGYGWSAAPDRPEMVPVAIAQHPTSNIGRSFHGGRQPAPGDVQPAVGLCFAEQWQRALAVDPELIFVTGWNEWVAQRFIVDGEHGPGFLGRRTNRGETFFVDQYNQEFSRDAEPMVGGHGDAYYFQLIDGIRRFKGVRSVPPLSAPVSLRPGQGFAGWAAVGPDYLDDLEDTTVRDHPGFPPLPNYVNRSGRNDFALAKVARDAQQVSFYIRCAAPISAPGPHWMTLLLNTAGDPTTGWEGYDLIVNRLPPENGRAVVERCTGGWAWERVTTVPLEVAGAELQVALPRALFGPGPLRCWFKWADNLPPEPTALDFLDRGDCAPNARFAYVVRED
ncbi:MAG: hypothetical protein IT204_12625 [Fimbriimonadaceae bacterium]|nr:hypothetical protein [Fimbriimonadaceae bacterium]